MTLKPEHTQDLESLPPILRTLLDAELAAGNEVIEVGHSFPAPPVGAYFMLARPVTTRARATGGGLRFYARNSSSYSAEFTDEKRFYFILEAPLPPPPEPDMNAIRAEQEARQRAADATRYAGIEEAARKARSRPAEQARALPMDSGQPAAGPDLIARFRASMELNYERWRDGIGYAIDLIESATPAERGTIEQILVMRGVQDWRDVEALAALNTPRAVKVLRTTLAEGSKEHATAVLRYAPDLASEKERTATLVAALGETGFFGGLTQALEQVADFHPPEVIDALLRGVLERESEGPAHFAAMLMYLHGKAGSAFDWNQRPYFLQFKTPDRTERERLFRDLCQRIGADPSRFLGET